MADTYPLIAAFGPRFVLSFVRGPYPGPVGGSYLSQPPAAATPVGV